jgi:hypothetical protein
MDSLPIEGNSGVSSPDYASWHSKAKLLIVLAILSLACLDTTTGLAGEGGEVAVGEAEGGAEVVGMATTADGAIGTQVIIVGTADGDGGVAALTRGGWFSRQSSQFRFPTRITAGTATGRDTSRLRVRRRILI